MKNYLDKIVIDISKSYYKSAVKYYAIGIELLHDVLKNEWGNYQSAVGNLTISLELLMKSFIAKTSIIHLYKNLPQEAQLYLSNPNLIKSIKSFRRYEIEMKSSSYNTIEFKDCAGIIYLIKPELKLKYKTQLSQMTDLRNKSVHSFLPNFQKYDLYRIGFLVITIFKELIGTRRFNFINKKFAKKNELFLKSYNEKRILKVKKKIEEAKEKSKEIDHIGIKLIVDNWWEYIRECPICKSDAKLEGETDIEYDGEDEYLTFYANSFHCQECNLKLEVEEFEFASIDTIYDRSDELDEWNSDFPYEPDPDFSY